MQTLLKYRAFLLNSEGNRISDPEDQWDGIFPINDLWNNIREARSIRIMNWTGNGPREERHIVGDLDIGRFRRVYARSAHAYNMYMIDPYKGSNTARALRKGQLEDRLDRIADLLNKYIQSAMVKYEREGAI